MLAGCNNGASSPTLDSGLPPSTSLGDLSAEEVTQICDGFEDLANELVGPERQRYVGCVAAGITTEIAGTGECAAARDNCLENGTTTPEPIELACEEAGPVDFEGCEATVGQLEACANDLAASVDSIADSVSCALVDDPEAFAHIGDDLEAALDTTRYESCQTLSEACLAFLDIPDVDVGETAE
jgi:hypothetical protein